MGPLRDDRVMALREQRARAALGLDFDGTLAPIVPVAGEAVPLPGTGDLLLRLTEAFGVVAVVSGRPVSYLRAHLPAHVRMYGLYGLEVAHDDKIRRHPEALAWRGAVQEAAVEAADELPAEVRVEHKGLALTLHFRGHPHLADEVRTWAESAARRTGLEARPAKMSVELHPAVAIDKGTVMEELADGRTAAAYVGDDVGDRPAFAALDRLAARGLTTLKVAVRTPESAPDLLREADVQVDAPEGAIELLHALL